MKSTLFALMLAVLTSGVAFASGAPWYKWRNVADRTVLCAKTSPGDAWEQYDGPYMDSRCKKSGNPQ